MNITFEGLTLPTIPEGITEKYQSLVVIEVKSATSSTVYGYYLIAVDSALSALDDSPDDAPETVYALIAMSLGKWCTYSVGAGGSAWLLEKEEADLEPVTGTLSLVQVLGIQGSASCRLVWSNVDIPYYPPTGEMYFTNSLGTVEVLRYFYYNGVSLPGITESMLKGYNYAIIMEIEDGSAKFYYLVLTVAPLYVAPFEAPPLGIFAAEDTHVNIYAFEPGELDNWFSLVGMDHPTGEVLLPIGVDSGVTYSLLWTSFDIPNGAPDSTEIYLKATRPANIYFDMTDTDGRISVTIPGSTPVTLYKISDEIPTFDQLKTYSSTQRLLRDGVDPIEITCHASTDPVDINAPVMLAPFGYICPYDNYTFTEDGISITIPEKGVYWVGLDAYEGTIELSGGNISVWYDAAVPVFAGGVTSSDFYGMNMAGPYPLTTQLAERDILIITYDDTTYVREVTYDDDENVGFCFVGDMTEDKSEPVFDNLPFFLGFMPDTDTDMLFVYTEEPGDHTLNILRYLPGEYNTGEPGEVPPTLAKRELSISLDVSHLHLNETAKLIITDNAADDSPVYSYGVNGKTVSIGNEDTVTGIGVGISTINITAPATSNFKEGQASLKIDVLRISREISCDYQNVDGVIYLGESRKPIITDNAAAESPTYTFSCTSGTADVFVFDEDGTLHAVGEGADTICMVAEQTPSYSSAVYYFTRTVQKFRHEREITATLDVIQEYGAKQVVLTDNAEAESPTYLFSSNDETIATVDSKGFVKALKVGTCYIGIYAEQTENYKHKFVDVPVVVTEAELWAISEGLLDGIADALRYASGKTAGIKAKNFREEILKLGTAIKAVPAVGGNQAIYIESVAVEVLEDGSLKIGGK